MAHSGEIELLAVIRRDIPSNSSSSGGALPSILTNANGPHVSTHGKRDQPEFLAPAPRPIEPGVLVQAAIQSVCPAVIHALKRLMIPAPLCD